MYFIFKREAYIFVFTKSNSTLSFSTHWSLSLKSACYPAEEVCQVKGVLHLALIAATGILKLYLAARPCLCDVIQSNLKYWLALCTIWSHGTKSRKLRCKLHGGTSKTEAGQDGPVGLALFWKSYCVTCIWAACMILYPVTRSCNGPIGRKQKNQTWHPSRGQQNVFFPSCYPLHYLHCYNFLVLEHVGLHIAWLKSSRILEWQFWGLLEAIWRSPMDRMTSQKYSLVAEYCLKWLQWCWILGSFGDKFHKEKLHFRGWNFGKLLKLLQGFYKRWKKIAVFGVTSFQVPMK